MATTRTSPTITAEWDPFRHRVPCYKLMKHPGKQEIHCLRPAGHDGHHKNMTDMDLARITRWVPMIGEIHA